MEILKTAGANDIYLVLKNVSYEAVYNALLRSLKPEDQIFAQLKKGVNELNWVHSDSGWRNYAQADMATRGLIHEALDQHKVSIRQTLQNVTILAAHIENILTTPSDDYFSYKIQPTGEIDVMISGWGYKKPLRTAVGEVVIETPTEKVQRVQIGFVEKGNLLPLRRFSIVTPSGNTLDKCTSEDGLLLIGNKIPVGSELRVVDSVSKFEFVMLVKEGQEQYIFDVTIPEPEPGPVISEPEEPEVPVMVKPVLQVEGNDGWHPCGFPIEFTYEGSRYNFLTDENGQIQLPELQTGKQMQVNDGIDHDNLQTFDIEKDKDLYIYHVPYSPRNGNMDIKVMTEDENGKPLDGNVCFKQDGRGNVWSKLDSEGVAWLDNNDFETGKDLKAQFVGGSRSVPDVIFQLDPDEKEYLLSLGKPKGSKWWLELIVAIVAAALLFLVWWYVLPLIVA